MLKYLIFTLSFIFYISCSTSSKTINVDSLHQKQVIAMGPGKTNAPGKCFMKLKEQNGDTNWYEVFCEGQTKYFQKAKQGLQDLGFPISQEDLNSKSFGKTTAIAMIEFQKENDLAYGGLDQTTLYHILKAVQEKK